MSLTSVLYVSSIPSLCTFLKKTEAMDFLFVNGKKTKKRFEEWAKYYLWMGMNFHRGNYEGLKVKGLTNRHEGIHEGCQMNGVKWRVKTEGFHKGVGNIIEVSYKKSQMNTKSSEYNRRDIRREGPQLIMKPNGHTKGWKRRVVWRVDE